jgi:hypothetical protein
VLLAETFTSEGTDMESDYSRPSSNGVLVRRRLRAEELSAAEKSKISQYLENPVSAGLWHLTAAWQGSSGLSHDVWNEILREIKDKDHIQIRGGKRDRRIKIDANWKEQMQEEVCSTLSFVMALFEHFAMQDAQQPERIEQFGFEHEAVQVVLDVLDVTAIKQSTQMRLRTTNRAFGVKGSAQLAP